MNCSYCLKSLLHSNYVLFNFVSLRENTLPTCRLWRSPDPARVGLVNTFMDILILCLVRTQINYFVLTCMPLFHFGFCKYAKVVNFRSDGEGSDMRFYNTMNLQIIKIVESTSYQTYLSLLENS